MENVDTAYALGQAGFEHGLTLSDNPYEPSDVRSEAWDQGWQSMDDYTSAQKKEAS